VHLLDFEPVPTNVMFSYGDVYTQAWRPPPPLSQFDVGLSELLTQLACAKDTSPSLVEALARRIVDEPQKDRPYIALFAKSLLDPETCSPAQTLQQWYVRRLRLISRDDTG
jgi:hypothetical protein